MGTFPLLPSALLSLLLLGHALAIDCNWLADPVSYNWNTAANWSSNSVPAYQDSVFFAQSSVTQISVTDRSEADVLTFQADASAYEIDIEANATIYIGIGINGHVSGITNLSGLEQHFTVKSDSAGGSGLIFLYGNAGSSNAFTTEPQRKVGGYAGTVSLFVDQSQIGPTTAGTCTFINEGGIMVGGSGGVLNFYNGSSGDHATIVNQAGVVSGASGGLTAILNDSSADHATITCEGATISGAGGGITELNNVSHARGATLIALGGSNDGGGGTIRLQNNADGTGARIEVFGNGHLDINADGLSIGSLEGDGLVLLQGHQLHIGDSNLSTTFAGSIQDVGSVIKVGTGTMTLTGVSTYTGGTFVAAGALVTNSGTGSATGSGVVSISAGILGGHGKIFGPVTIGNGSGTGAFLKPSFGSDKASRLRINHSLTFKADGSYKCDLSLGRVKADQVSANGVTIETGAQFLLFPRGFQTLPVGTVFTVINNSATTPILGTFANLADGSTITAGTNTLQVSYEGGSGNDLTLTVVP